ncbi:unnamed protein product [Enterobius vermicularis]|uniref:DUF1758 domain-containing protein n=1 Tax=Enterobius vermicularis TaxID=51028 RepID=A0A0N4VPQ9_ENTVE|nr:unnamed protein product [Enterobius vermicularis]
MAHCAAKVREETPTTVYVNEQSSRIKLQQLSLPIYSRDPKGWMEFWERSSSAVDAVNIPATQKFTCLLSCLQGSTYAAIAGMRITSANYDNAIQTLKRRYGDKKLIKTALYQQLSGIRCAGPQLKDLRAIVDMIDKICNQLTAYGEDVNHASIVAQIEKKLPPGTFIKLEEAKLVSLEWNVNIMREKLHESIRLRERAYTVMEYRSGKRDWNILELIQKPIVQSVNSSFNQSTKKNNKNIKFPCAFCRGDHYHDECFKYKTTLSRKRRINEVNLCSRCLRSKHFASICKYTRPCFYCSEDHHRALCEKKDKGLRKEVEKI